MLTCISDRVAKTRQITAFKNRTEVRNNQFREWLKQEEEVAKERKLQRWRKRLEDWLINVNQYSYGKVYNFE